ncbi:MAG: cobalamin-binding protein [Acidiferrobacterales bacterium]
MKLALTNKKPARAVLLLLAFLAPGAVAAIDRNVVAIDSEGKQIVLAAPASRIISLSPHITELLFAAGAGDRLVGVVEYSDYPAAARTIKRIGSAFRVDMEGLVSLQPDLVVAWTSGNSDSDIAMIKRFGIPIFYSDPKHLEDIPTQITNLAQLSATEEIAVRATRTFTRKHKELLNRHSGQTAISVFYQLWHQPIMTVNKNHLINDVIELCGGVNVFASLSSLTPVVGVEDVITANPDYIIASSVGRSELTSMWGKWSGFAAAGKKGFIIVPADLLHRQGPRIIQAAEIMCRGLAAAG